MEKIGLIPAAGTASRLGSLAFSKELLPIAFYEGKKESGLKAVSTCLLEKYLQAAIENGFSVYGHLFPDFHFIDVGTPDNLAQVLKDNFSNAT